jgi:hypothetical protein
MSNLTGRMTEQIISANATTKVKGIAYRQETFISVEWLWFILPLGVAFLGGVALVASMVNSCIAQPGPLWKSSTLSYLFHTTFHRDIETSRLPHKLSQMEGAAETLWASMSRNRQPGPGFYISTREEDKG